jgi:SAM-dependent methyltransferase
MKAMDYAAEFDWPGYFDAVKGKPARETLVKALELFEKDDAAAKPGARKSNRAAPPRIAVDVGCGEGRDTRELLRRAAGRPWSVLATDGSSTGLDIIARSLTAAERPRVRLVQCTMEDLPRAYRDGVPHGVARAPARQVDLVNASFSLPFCKPADLPRLWRWIDGLIRPGGRFAGQIFGDRDTWAHVRKTTGVPRRQIDRMFAGYVFEELREEEKDDVTAMGEPKHWHVFHIVARKREAAAKPRTRQPQ